MIDVNISKSELLSLLSGVKQSGENEYQCTCPFCGKQKHFYIGFDQKHYPWSCKKCQEDGNVFRLLKHLGVLSDYLHKSIDLTKLVKLGTLNECEVEDVVLFEPEKKLPKNFTRIYSNEYLKSRGFLVNDFYQYEVGLTFNNKKYDNYVIFPIREDGIVKGYVGRSVFDKNECESMNILRYNNSKKTNFSNLLYGYNEITKKTKIVIIVEGIFDKIKVDRVLNLNSQDDIKCICSFGNKISSSQILKLKCTNIVEVILFYDLDAINEMKGNALKIQKHFNLSISCIVDGKDPDESSSNMIFSALQNNQDFKKFYYDKCNGRKLKI